MVNNGNKTSILLKLNAKGHLQNCQQIASLRSLSQPNIILLG